MPVTKEQLASIIGGRAREMCSPQNDRKLNALANKNPLVESTYFDDPDPTMYNDGGTADRFDAMCGFGVSDMSASDMKYNQSSASNSRMPDNIKQSMLQERIDVSRLGNTSVLDGMNIPQQSRGPVPQRSVRQQQMITEQQYQQPQQSVGFDYTALKAIINECLNEYFSKQPLNESALKTIQLKKGTISLVDNSGNIFRAKLEKIKNADD